VFGAILIESETYKARWELHKPRTANRTEKFHKKFFFENVSLTPKEKKLHFESSRNAKTACHK